MTPALRAINRRILELKRQLRGNPNGETAYAYRCALDEALHIRELVKREGLISLSQLKRIECMKGKK